MNTLTQILGFPHELLHLFGLLLIGRRAVGWTRTHVDLPPDLTDRQYVIVAGMPALVFGLLAVIGAYGLANAHSYAEAIPAIVVLLFGSLSFSGTAGDLQLIADRLTTKKP